MDKDYQQKLSAANNPQKEYTGTWIPREIMESEELSPIEKLCYAEIACFNECFASNAWFAGRLQVSEGRARKIIASLIDKGFVIRCGFDGRFRSIKVVRDARQTGQKVPGRVVKNDQSGQKRPGRLVENDHADWSKSATIDNNIDNNKDNNKESYKAPSKSSMVVSLESEPAEKPKAANFESVFVSKAVSEPLKQALLDFVEFRKLNKKKMTCRALELAINKVRALEQDESRQIATINQSIENGWIGLYKLKEDTRCNKQSADATISYLANMSTEEIIALERRKHGQ